MERVGTRLVFAPARGTGSSPFLRARNSACPRSHQFRCGDDVTVPNGTDLRKGSIAEYSNENDTPDTNTIVLCSLPKLRCRSWAPL
jgi:hypothetical protein